jgi:hypothetical protein
VKGIHARGKKIQLPSVTVFGSPRGLAGGLSIKRMLLLRYYANPRCPNESFIIGIDRIGNYKF